MGGTRINSSPYRSPTTPMDPTALFNALQPAPVVIERAAVTWQGALLPVVIPLDGLPVTQRARLVLQHESLGVDLRVGAALDAGLTEEAWALVIRTPGPVTRSVGLDLTLSAWAAREQARLHLPATRDAIQVLTANERPLPGLDAAIALATTREMLAALSWPCWSGPVVLVVGDLGQRDPIPGSTRVLRPALPILRLGTPPPGTTASELLVVELTRLALDLQTPPASGWPAWLHVGLEEVAKAKMRGEGPSPLKMLDIRQHAGAGALAELLLANKPDPQLAEALCAPLVHTRRRHLLSNLLDVLRGGAQSAGAIQLVYGLSLQQLTEER